MRAYYTVVLVFFLTCTPTSLIAQTYSYVYKFEPYTEYKDVYCSGEAEVYGAVDSDFFCARRCQQTQDCGGFFYNSYTHSCSTVKNVSVPQIGCHAENGSHYYGLKVPSPFGCYHFTGSDLSRLGSETKASVCNSYQYNTYIKNLGTIAYGCSDCECCQRKGCYSGVLQLYNGTWSTTRSGRTCQRWDEQYPHTHTRLVYGVFPPGETSAQSNNYCRDPDYEGYLWCYTVDSNVRYENCGIPECT